MTSCTACGADVTGKKFCPQCGTPVQSMPVVNATNSANVCPRCNGEVTPGAAFCMHCGSSLTAQPATPQAPTPAFCTSCGKQSAPGARFCQHCGSSIGAAEPMMQGGQYQQQPYQQGQYQQQPYQQGQYVQPQYAQQQPQQYAQPPQQYGPQYGQQQYAQPPQQYAQGGYQQQPMALRCPVCQAISAVGTQVCAGCHNSLANVVPTPANMPVGQQGGIGGFLQGNNGKMVMGALGGAAAVLGGEMLLNGVEGGVERRVEGDMGYGYGERRHHRREDEGMLGGLGNIANDLGLF